MAETTSSYITATQSGWRYYLRLAANSFATMLDLGLYALGAALAGSGLALLLASFGVVQRDSGLSTGSSLVTSMVLAVVGAFLMGIASEGPARRDNLVIVNSELDRALSRAVASAVVGIALIFLAGVLRPRVADFTEPLQRGVELMRAAGIAGLWPVPLIGVPLAWGLRHPSLLGRDGLELELPVMFTVWVVVLFYLA
jgi:hypothetical protein